jgi:hypothetical protein
MARKRKKKKAEGGESGVQMEMTPMIDVVLQLIIFFMLVMDFSSRDLVPLKLPQAQTAEEEQQQDEWTITVNIAHEKGATRGDINWDQRLEISNWFLHVRGERYYLQATGDQKGLDDLRTDMIAYAEKRQSNETAGDSAISEVPLIIRSDLRAPWGLAQRVMSIARDPKINIYKVKLAAEIPRKDDQGN